MFRLRRHFAHSPPRGALLVVLLLTAQLALFVHALGHEYATNTEQVHVQCGLCGAAHQLDHGLAAAAPGAFLGLSFVLAATLVAANLTDITRSAFRARAPPALPHLF